MWCKQRRKKKDSLAPPPQGGGSGRGESDKDVVPLPSGKTNNNNNELPRPPTRDHVTSAPGPNLPSQQVLAANGPIDILGQQQQQQQQLPNKGQYRQGFLTGQSSNEGVAQPALGGGGGTSLVQPQQSAPPSGRTSLQTMPVQSVHIPRGVVSMTPPPQNVATGLPSQQFNYQGSGSSVKGVLVGGGGGDGSVPPPNLKPGPLSVPLPSAPLSATILESLKGTLAAESSASTTNTTATQQDAPPEGAKKLSQTGANTAGTSGSLPASVANQARQLQKVIETQQSQLTLLQNISQLMSKSGGGQSATAVRGGSSVGSVAGGVAMPSRVQSGDHVTPSLPQGVSSGRIIDRAQTFDYGNHSNKALEQEAARQQLEKGYYHHHGNTGRWP